MICTNIEQSQQLVRLGLDPVTADMCFEMEKGNWTLNVGKKSAQVNRGLAIPAWSLSALLEVMPSFIDYKGQKLRLTIEKAGIWNVFYLGTKHRINEIWFNGEYDNPVEPAYKMVCWLLENNLIKKGGQNESES